MTPRTLLQVLCSLIAALALFSIMALTFFDVLARKLLSNSIPGSLEVTELLMVAVIFAALPLVSLRGEHVVFDSLDALLPRWLRLMQNLLVHLLCGLAMLALGWLMWRAGTQFGEAGETTAQLKIGKAAFLHGMGLLCGITGLVHLSLMLRPPKTLREGDGVVL